MADADASTARRVNGRLSERPAACEGCAMGFNVRRSFSGVRAEDLITEQGVCVADVAERDVVGVTEQHPQ